MKAEGLRFRINLKAVRVLLLATAVGILVYFSGDRFAFTFTNSVNHSLFYLEPGKKPSRWDYVIFKIPEHINPDVVKEIKIFKAKFFIKQAACLPGDRLTTKGDEFFCNGAFLCRAKKKSLTGKPLKHFVFNGVIPKGFFFAYGSNKDSYDSRYFGLVPLKSVRAVAYPIF